MADRAVKNFVDFRFRSKQEWHFKHSQFRQEVVNGIYESWIGKPEGDPARKSYVSSQGEGPARRLLRERPAGLVPPGAFVPQG